MEFAIDGKRYDIALTLDELPYHRFIDTQKAIDEMNVEIKKQRVRMSEEEGEEGMSDEELAERYAAVDIDDGFIYNIVDKFVDGDVKSLAYALPDDSLEDLFNRGFFLTFGEDVTIQRLYVHLNTIIDNFYDEEAANGNSVNYSIEWYETKRKRKPCTYIVNRQKAQVIITGDATKFTTGETIEIKEWQRLTMQAVENRGDLEGNFAFTLGLAEFAILVRKPGEELPFNKAERDAFIKKRMEIFETLPTSDVLKVRFFLLRILNDWLKAKALERSFEEKNLISTGTRHSKKHSAKRYRGRKAKRKGRGV